MAAQNASLYSGRHRMRQPARPPAGWGRRWKAGPTAIFLTAPGPGQEEGGTDAPMVSVDTCEPPLLISVPVTAPLRAGAAAFTFLASETGS